MTTKQAPSDPNPYQETCANSHKIGGKGGLTLRRVGEKVQAGLGLPAGEGRASATARTSEERDREDEARLLAGAFDKKRVTVVLKGTNTSRSGNTTLIYRWSATVTLARS